MDLSLRVPNLSRIYQEGSGFPLRQQRLNSFPPFASHIAGIPHSQTFAAYICSSAPILGDQLKSQMGSRD
jgi:hypothetical protein